jgi:tRNA (cmo5U34)-methyltransferase
VSGWHDWHDPAGAATWTAVADDSPARAEQLDLLLEVVAALRPRTALEVGVGSGLVAAEVLRRVADVELVGVDFSRAMLELARDRLSEFGDRATLRLVDVTQPQRGDLQERAFDVVYSVQALHHLEDDAKREALEWIAKLLAPGGFFLMRDKVALAREIVPAYTAIWNHRRRKMPTDLEAYDRYLEQMLAGGDIPATLDAHLEWLRAAGLTTAILHAEAHYFLFAARRPA